MAKNKILYVCQEISPYLPENEFSKLSLDMARQMQERGDEVRTFMPRYGCINERRNQLHEVIRLSGMNLIINDNDHQLIIKVASIPCTAAPNTFTNMIVVFLGLWLFTFFLFISLFLIYIFQEKVSQ